MAKGLTKRCLISMIVMLGTQLLSAAPPLTFLDPAETPCGHPLNVAGAHYVLTGDLECTGAVNGLVITADNVTLHLGGHTISNTTCGDSADIAGVYAIGGLTGVRIEGGTISGFNDGISLSSSHSFVTGTKVTGACYHGILVQADHNVIEKNLVTASGYGVALVPATYTLVRWNDLSGNADGVVISGTDSNDNTVEDNIITNNTLPGGGTGVFLANGTRNNVLNNAISYNHVGVAVYASGNQVKSNIVSGNTGTGIAINDDGNGSSVTENKVFGSGGVDLADLNAVCGTNTWLDNIFKTDAVQGVDDGGPEAGCIK
jgi:parallel beta-helix repeat protein